MFLANVDGMGDNWLPQTIAQQKTALAERPEFFMAVLAQKSAATWHDQTALDAFLTDNSSHIPFCNPRYAVNTAGLCSKMLRQTDDTVYLRSASLNVINGMARPTFSCDAPHYMPAPGPSAIYNRREYVSSWFR